MLIIARRIGNGRCMLDIVMKGTAPTETTSGSELAGAARRLIRECVGAGGGVGGVVSNIGKSAPRIGKNAEDHFRVTKGFSDSLLSLFVTGQQNTLGIILRSYEPTYIECGTVTRPFGEDRCSNLLHSLPADISPKIIWGPANQPVVDLVLPYSFVYEYPREF